MIGNKEYGFLDSLSEENGKKIIALGKKLEFKQKKHLFLRGDSGDSFYIILSGSVIISVNSDDGREIVLNRLSSGDIFGEISMFDHTERTADACVLAGTKLLSIDRSAFTDFLDKNPTLYRNIIALLCKRLRWFSAHIDNFVLASSLDRLLAKLISLANTSTHSKNALIEMSQSDLAKTLGLSRENVNKNLQILQDRKLLKLGRKKIYILDLEKLNQFQRSMTA